MPRLVIVRGMGVARVLDTDPALGTLLVAYRAVPVEEWVRATDTLPYKD